MSAAVAPAREPDGLTRMRRSVQRVASWRLRVGAQIAAALAIYVAASVLLFGVPVLAHPATTYVGKPQADTFLFLWSLGWWPHAVEHGLNPFLTKVVWAPGGYNLAWATAIPGPSLVLWPVTAAFGPAASYNVLILLSPALGAWTAFVLCRRVTQRFWPSLVGGYVFGFSTYELGHMNGHPNLSLAFLVPVCAYLFLRRYDGSMSAGAFVALMALALVGEFSISTEVFATMTAFAAVSLPVALVLLRPAGRRRLLRATAWLLAAYAVTAVVVSPYLYAMAAYPTPFRVVPLHVVRASTDLANLVIPNNLIAFGHGWFQNISVHFARPLPVGAAYMGVILLAVMAAFAWTARKTFVGRFLPALFVIFLVASLGPVLKVSGKTGIHLPWKLVLHLPLIHRALPGRFVMYAFLVLGISVAAWITLASRWAWARWVVAASGALLLLPNFGVSAMGRTATPSFFADGLYRRVIRPGELVVPAGIPVGRSMLYQAESGMYFRIPAGYFGSSPPGPKQQHALARRLSSGHPPLFQVPQVKAFLRSAGVRAILVITDKPARLDEWSGFLRFLHVSPVRIGGVSVYRIPGGGAE